jgi:hypothetical protein
MERMQLYQILYPNINSSRVWQIGCAKQTMIETRAEKFIIGQEASKDAPCWSVSLAMRPQKMPLIGGLCLVQQTSTTKGLNDLPLIKGLCLVQRTLTMRVSMICPSSEDFVSFNGLQPPRVSMICPSLISGLCLVQRALTARGLNDLPLVGGLCLVQWTLTTKGLNDLPLIRGLCLVTNDRLQPQWVTR